jgi:excisionase family DNA binding protein
MGDHVQAPLLLTRSEVAERLKLSLVTVDRLRRRRELEVIKLGRAVRIPAESVTAYLLKKGVRS